MGGPDTYVHSRKLFDEMSDVRQVSMLVKIGLAKFWICDLSIKWERISTLTFCNAKYILVLCRVTYYYYWMYSIQPQISGNIWTTQIVLLPQNVKALSLSNCYHAVWGLRSF